jgi:hypothetical protein
MVFTVARSAKVDCSVSECVSFLVLGVARHYEANGEPEIEQAGIFTPSGLPRRNAQAAPSTWIPT